MKSKLIPRHQSPSQPLVLSQDNTRVDSHYVDSIPITETNLYKQYLADPYKNSDFNTWKQRQELIRSSRKNEKVKADKRAPIVKKQESEQGKAIYNQQQRKEQEDKNNKLIWTGIGLGGLALAQATPAAPYIDAAFATHGALGLAEQADEGTLGWNGETALNALQVLPFGIRGVGKAVKYADDVARLTYAPYDFYRTVLETTPTIIPKLTTALTHTSVKTTPKGAMVLQQRLSSLTNAEKLGLPKQVRHSMTTDQADAVDDLVLYINSGQHRQTFTINPVTGNTTYTTRATENNPLFMRWFEDSGKQMKGKFAKQGLIDLNGLQGEIRYLPEKNLASWLTKPSKTTDKLNYIPGEAAMFGDGPNTYSMRLTSPRVDIDDFINDLLNSNIADEVKLGKELDKLPRTLDKTTMKSFWQGVGRTQRPGTYLTGDPGISPVGNSLIQEYRSNRFKNGISLLPHKSTIIARTGLSPDSYSSIIRQALREGNELRWGQGFTNWNPSAVVNKRIYDTWRKYTKGEITAEEYKAIFDEWAKALGGREATIRRIPERTEFVKDNLGNITEKFIPAKEFVIIPHPYIYKKKHGGRIKK